MDRTRFSFTAHGQMRLCNPAGSARVDRAIEVLDLPRGAEVVDFGAGKCEWLSRIAGRWGARCVGVEPARVFADEAGRLHGGLVESGRLRIVEESAAGFLEGNAGARFDGALCIGSSHAFGGYGKALDAMIGVMRDGGVKGERSGDGGSAPGGAHGGGGVIVVGEGYWKKRPDAEYLKALGAEESDMTSHEGNIRTGIERGLTPRWCSTVTEDEWDEYEWAYSRGIEEFVREHPDDADAGAMLERSRGWREVVMRWGRETMGFGVYVFGVAD